MKLRFLGATGTVTGSKYLLQTTQSRVLVDCGLFQGFKQLRLRNWAPPPFDPKSLHAVVLTHAHLDHSGYLPLLVKLGFGGAIHCTEPTYELCRILLPDAARLQEEQAEHANRFGYSKHRPALPLYTQQDAEHALRRFTFWPFEREFPPAPGITAQLLPAGHILGASIAVLHADQRTLVFSGDLGRSDDLVMRPPAPVHHADALLVECTYGDRLHDRTDPRQELGRIIATTAARGGTVLIPAFAVGRAQLILHHLQRLKAEGAIPRALPIYLDSPMAADVTDVYLRHLPEHRLTPGDCQALREVARRITTPDESRELDQSSWPMVIVAGSGMATGGRILHHLKRFAPDPRNTVLFAGFQAGGTRGEAMVHGATSVKIHGDYVPIRAQVSNLDRLSAHADAAEVVAWLAHFRKPPRRVFLTHGEPAAADAMRKRIAEALRWEAEVPDYLEEAEL